MIVIKKCKVCGEKYEAYDRPHASTIRSRTIRMSNSRTCSPRCAKKMDYNKVYKKIKEEKE